MAVREEEDRRKADRAQLARVAELLRSAGATADDIRWVDGIYDQAMALRRIARGQS